MSSAMQNDANGNMTIDQEDDQDSLFGSPPSLPVRGRSPSPALALPSASNSTQNVGTIALPGSHHYSELPVTPLALSLSYALNELPHRPPALPYTAIPSNTATPTSSSRASSAGPSVRPKKKSKKIQSKESTPRPPPPEIPLPDPSAPVPANFLRNQSALLGTAGLVGGVRPAALTNRYSRGTAASNPIVIDDDDPVPASRGFPQFRTYPCPKPKEIDPSLLPTPSTQEVVAVLIGQKDIFPVLESVLRLIADGGGPQALNPPTPEPLTSFRRTPQSFQPAGSENTSTSALPSTSLGPPLKKRRLNRVPAGAADWDVPYPFPEGQGPAAYRKTWQRERGKQLISQLVTLIKSAARKAATRKYLDNERARKQYLESQWAYERMREAALGKIADEPKVHGHYRPSTVTYGLRDEAAATAARAHAQEALMDASNGNTKPNTITAAPAPQQPTLPSTNEVPNPGIQASTPFDQLISSLLAATPSQNTETSDLASLPNNATSGGFDVQAAPSTPNGSQVTEGLDQGLFDNCMSILQTFPMPASDFSSSAHDVWGLPSQPDTSTSTPLNNDFGFFDFDQTRDDPNYVDTGSYDFGSIFDTEMPSSNVVGSLQAAAQPATSTQNDVPVFSAQDLAIDPTLLAISISKLSAAPTSTTLEITPSLTGSPMPSLSSLGDADPSTPNSALWDLSMPEVFAGSGGEASASDNGLVGHEYRGGRLASQGMWGCALRNSMKAYDFRQGGVEEYSNAFIASQSDGSDAPWMGMNKGRDTCESMARPPLLLPTAARSEFADFSLSSQVPPQAPVWPVQVATTNVIQPSRRHQNSKADILKRANERKKLLMSEIEKVRTQLWETTVEQGVLSHMNKLCTHTT
ncbi:hypothetical protein H0H87_009927 [Tephrocybe sp. NHM501043]|nr:hypothetical protein H0H87_009927 [Tephrocybe sp. NHM501043]